ncbi:hypothetical protein L345_09911, partial [Ophiophagus hannah]
MNDLELFRGPSRSFSTPAAPHRKEDFRPFGLLGTPLLPSGSPPSSSYPLSARSRPPFPALPEPLLPELPGPRRQFCSGPTRSSLLPAERDAGNDRRGGLLGPHQPGQPGFKFTVAESCDRIKDEFQFLQAQYHSLKVEYDKLANEKTEMQRHYVM